MHRDTSFHDHVLHDLLAQEKDVSSKAMFGGWGLYMRGKIFGIIIGRGLYFKIGEYNRSAFEALDSGPFIYEKKGGRRVTLPYWIVPEEVMEDRERFRSLLVATLRP